MPSNDSETPRYRLGPRSTRGLIAGWRTGQIACVAIGLVLGVGTLRSVGGAAGGLLALVAAGGGVAVAMWPLGGRTVEQWVPTVVSFGMRVAAEGRHRPWQSSNRPPRGPIARLSLFALPEPAGEARTSQGVTRRSGRARGGAVRLDRRPPPEAVGADDARERTTAIATVTAAVGVGVAGVGVAGAGAPPGGCVTEAPAPGAHAVGRAAAARAADEARAMAEARAAHEARAMAEERAMAEARDIGYTAAMRVGPNETAAPGGVGVIGDSESSTWSAVLPVGGTGFALLGEAERCDRIAAWSSALAAMARDGTGLQRLQWLSTTYPAWLDGPLAGGGSGTAGEDYARLLDEAAPNLWGHEVCVVVTVRHAGVGRGGSEAASARLREQLAALDERLRGAGLAPSQPLSPLGLASFVRRSFEVAPLDGMATWPWPLGIDNAWSHVRTDATWHASYWIAEWPRSEVGGGFLLPVLLVTGLRRVVSVTMAPLPALTAVRRAERERTEGTADEDLRHRHGFAVTARSRREQEGRQQREVELADGHAGYRYSGYVTVTELDEQALENACGRLEQAAALAQLELRRLYGAQEEGYCCTLPTGRGCR